MHLLADSLHLSQAQKIKFKADILKEMFDEADFEVPAFRNIFLSEF